MTNNIELIHCNCNRTRPALCIAYDGIQYRVDHVVLDLAGDHVYACLMSGDNHELHREPLNSEQGLAIVRASIALARAEVDGVPGHIYKEMKPELQRVA